mgnify:CR=1 FL=1
MSWASRLASAALGDTLAAVRVEEPEVFEHAHRLVFRFLREGRITGLRIDRVDLRELTFPTGSQYRTRYRVHARSAG